MIASYKVQAFGAWEQLERTVNGGGYRFLTWSKGAQAIRRRATGREKALTDEEIAEQDLGTDDLIAIDPEDWPRLRVVLEVFFGVGERDGITAAAEWLTERGIGWSWAKPARYVAAGAAALTTRAAADTGTTSPVNDPWTVWIYLLDVALADQGTSNRLVRSAHRNRARAVRHHRLRALDRRGDLRP